MNHEWYRELSHWHFVFVFGLAYTLWRVLARHNPRSRQHTEARLNYINFLVALAFGVLSLSGALYIYHPDRPQISISLLYLFFLVWTGTVSFVLWNSRLSKGVKTLFFVIILGPVIIQYLSSAGVTRFLAKLDEFIELGGNPGTGLKLSVFLKWLFFFSHTFIVLHYYGHMYEISYREKIRRGEKREGLQEDAIDRAIVVISVGFAFFVALVLIGTDLGRLSLFSGLVAAGVSIALRDLLANTAAGILLLWDKSVKLDDVISMDKDRYGIVKSMTMRYLVLEDRNEIRFLVPNSDLINRTITNWTQAARRIRLRLDFGVAYGSDIEKIKDIIKAVCLRNSRVLQDPPPRILILGLGDSKVDFQLRLFIGDPENGIRNVMGEIYEAILERFTEAKISIPFPQREIKLLPQSSVDVTLIHRTE